jgi:hypothetical protein
MDPRRGLRPSEGFAPAPAPVPLPLSFGGMSLDSGTATPPAVVEAVSPVPVDSLSRPFPEGWVSIRNPSRKRAIERSCRDGWNGGR